MANGWRDFYNAVASTFDRVECAGDTVAEVDFLIAELQLQSGANILDVGCGTGRHAIELARRGYKVTGVDFASAMLEQARKKSAAANIEVNWVEIAAQDFSAEDEFDAAISINKGALCLFTEEDNIWGKDMAILANISNALKASGKFLLTVLNAFALIRSMSDEQITAGEFDLFTLSQKVEKRCVINAEEVRFNCIKRYYSPSEVVRMVNRIGLKVDHTFGGTIGSGRCDTISLDEEEFMVIGHRKKK